MALNDKPKQVTSKHCPISLQVMVTHITDWEKFRYERYERTGIKPTFVMAKLWDDQRARSHHLTGFEENWLHAKKKTYGYRERSGRQTTGEPERSCPPSP